MNQDQLFNHALQALQGESRPKAMVTLRQLAEQRHVPATFAYADALFQDSPSDAFLYLIDKFKAGLIGAAFRAVLSKVFFAEQHLAS